MDYRIKALCCFTIAQAWVASRTALGKLALQGLSHQQQASCEGVGLGDFRLVVF